MARRGSLVGDAYIRIHADTRFMAREIRRDMEATGKNAADDFGNNFSKRLLAKRIQIKNSARAALAEALVSGDFDRLFKKSGATIDEFTTQITRDLKRMSTQGRISNLDLSDSLSTLDHWQQRTLDSAKRLAEEVNNKRLLANLDSQNKALDAQHRAWAKLGPEMVEGVRHLRNLDTRWGRLTDRIRISSTRLDDFALISGRVFGKGSRNNFLNFIGSLVAGFASIPAAIGKGIGALIDGAHDLIQNFQVLRANGASFGEALTTIVRPALTAVAGGAVALGVGLVAAAALIPIFVSLLFELVGALTAVAGAIGVALIGALLPLGPIIAAVAASMLPIVLIFSDMKKEGSALTKVLKPLTKAWEDLQKAVKPDLRRIVKSWAGFADTVKTFVTPLVKGMASAIADVSDAFGRALDSPQTKAFLRAFEISLPRIFRNLGFGVNELLLGLLAFFRPILPFAERMATAFNNLMTTFRLWASSGRGQNSIANFMDVAWTAAQKLWHILTTVFDILGRIFFAGAKGPGLDFLTWLDQTLTKFDKWLNTPAGKTAVEEFFTRVRDFMVGVKTIMEDVGVAVSKLTSKESQDQLNKLVTSITTISGAFEKVAEWINTIHALLSDPATFAIAGNPGEAIDTNFLSPFQALSLQIPALIAAAFVEAGVAIAAGMIWIAVQIVDKGPLLLNAMAAPFVAAFQAIAGWISRITQLIIDSGWLGAAAVAVAGLAAALFNPFIVAYHTISSWIATTAQRIRNGGWLASAVAVVAGILSTLAAPFISAWRTISTWISNIRGVISRGGFKAAAIAVVAGITSALTAPFTAAWATISGIIALIKAGIQSIIDLANKIPILRNVVPGTASGGVFTGPTKRLIGEAGPEAVVPLNRPLSLVDPSVRWLSAIAQGKSAPMAAGGVATAGKTLVVSPGAIQVNTIAQDPENVARAMLDRLVTAIA